MFDRMIGQTEPAALPKSFYHVWGTNHNFYNSEWQQADANARWCMHGLHRPHAHLRRDAAGLARAARDRSLCRGDVLHGERRRGPRAVPQHALRSGVPRCRSRRGCGVAIIRAGVAESRLLEDFINATGTSSYGLPNTTGGTLTVAHGEATVLHPPGFKVGVVSGVTPSSSTFFQTNFAASGSGFNLSSYNYLDLRVDRRLRRDRRRHLVQGPARKPEQYALERGHDQPGLRGSGCARRRGRTTLQTVRVPLSSSAVRSSGRCAECAWCSINRCRRSSRSRMCARPRRPPRRRPRGSRWPRRARSVAATRRDLEPGSQAAVRARLAGAGALAEGQPHSPSGARRFGLCDHAVEPPLFRSPRAALRLTIGDVVSEAAENPNGDLYTVRFLVDADVYEAARVRRRGAGRLRHRLRDRLGVR